jgi:hypothetical protein
MIPSRVADDEDRADRLMGSPLADAAEGPWPMKASASDDQQVDLVGEVGERFDGTAGVDDGVGEKLLDLVEVDALAPRRGHDDVLREEALRERLSGCRRRK